MLLEEGCAVANKPCQDEGGMLQQTKEITSTNFTAPIWSADRIGAELGAAIFFSGFRIW